MSALARTVGVTVVAVAFAVGYVLWAPTAGASMRLTDPASGTVEEVALEGAVTHVVFLATWCPPCVEELQELADLEAHHRRSGYRLVLVAIKNRQSPQRLTQFARTRDLPGVLRFDADGQVQRSMGAEDLPTHVLFDANGVEVARSGELDEEFVAKVDAAVTGR